MRYRLRTLLILSALLPPLLAGGWWKYSAWRAEREARALYEELGQAEADQLVHIDPIIDEALLIELSSPPKTPMQPLQPEAIDLDKLTRPGAPARARE
jgi:hypothetical protein